MQTGTFNDELSFEDGLLSLTYLDGDDCDGRKHSTKLEFICDNDAVDSPKLDLVEEGKETCRTIIFISTSLACHKGEEVDCIASDPDTGHQFDLSPLRNYKRNYFVGDTRERIKYTYAINVCRTLVPLRDFPDCSQKSAACQISKTDDSFLERVS